MSYRLTQFGTLTLPVYDPKYDLAPAQAMGGLVATTAGAYWPYGDGEPPPKYPQPLQYEAVVLEDTVSEWRTVIDALRVRVGRRAMLWRQAVDDGDLQWCDAVLQSANLGGGVDQRRHSKVRLQFQQIGPWYGRDYSDWALDDGHFLDTGLYLDSSALTIPVNISPKTTIVTNHGNKISSYVIAKYAPAGTTTTQFTITIYDADGAIRSALAFLGTVPFGGTDTLVIDGAAMTVENNGNDAYDDLTLFPYHRSGRWLELGPGANTVTVTRTGGSTASVLRLEYREVWA
jgi:hypothetical protein